MHEEKSMEQKIYKETINFGNHSVMCLCASKIRKNFQFLGNTLSPSFTPSILPQA